MSHLIKKRSYRLIILCLIATFLTFPIHISANNSASFQNKIELPTRDVNLILNSLNSRIAKKRINLFAINSSEPEKGAIMVLLGMGVKSNSFDYLMTQAPKEVIMGLVKTGLKIAYDPGISTIAEIGIDKAKEDVISWLVRNELLIGGGELSVSSYKTYDNKNESFEFPYLLIHNPKTKEIEIVIYSPDSVKPPKSQGGLTAFSVHGGNFWDENQWLQKGKTHLSPFTVKVSGKIEKGQDGGYLWQEGPSIEIDLSSPVPEFQFKRPSIIERQLLSLNRSLLAVNNAFEILSNTARSVGNRINEAGRNIWDKLRSRVSNLANMGGAAISSFFFSPNNNTTVVSLRDEASSFQKTIERENISESDEVKELKKRISELESKLEIALRETNKPPEEDPEPNVARVITERVNINRALIDDLTRIVHIGPARAREIVRLRPFSSLDDLTRVPGIGEKIISDIKKQGLAYVEYQEIDEIEEEEIKEKEIKVTDEKDPCLLNGVDLNNAPLADLVFLKGIGPVIAQRIIDHRRSTPFISLDDLELVKGIGPTTMKNIKDQACAYVKATSPTTRSYSPSPTTERKPKMEVDKEEFSFRWEIGEELPKQSLTIQNKGGSPLNWKMTNYKWISFGTNSGTILPGKIFSVTLTIDPTGLTIGEYSVTIPIESNSENSPHKIDISMIVLPAPKLAESVVITEIKINEREFIELYNPTKEDIKMTGWQLSYYSSKREWNRPLRSWNFPKDSVIASTSYFLIGVYEYPTKDGNPNSDWELLTAGGNPYISGQLSNSDGSLAIFNCDPKDKIDACRIDTVGWGETLVKKGEASNVPKEGESIKRRKSSQGKYINNENNSTDFIIGLPMPTNSKGEIGDIFPPEAITDLKVTCQDGGAILEWTAPSDPDTPQERLAYEIRYHKGHLSKDNWGDGVLSRSIPEVSTNGENESIIIKDLNYGTDYYFGLITLDTKNQSPLSNIVSCTTESVRYGSLWTGFQGNSQRTGRIAELTSNKSAEPNVEILISGERNSDHINDPIIVDNYGSIYFVGEITIEGELKKGFLAFGQDRELKWYHKGETNQFFGPVSLPDGSIFLTLQGKLCGKLNLMKINRDGTIEWINKIEGFYPIGQPAVSDDGKIHLLLSALNGLSGKLIAIESDNGSIDWKYEIDKGVAGDISPVIDQNGSIYFSLNDTLYSIASNGDLRWKRSFPFISPNGNKEYGRTTNPVISDGAIYFFVKEVSWRRDSLYALDLNNPESELWKIEGLWGLRGLPVINYNGDLFVFNFSDPVFRITNIIGYNRQGEPIDGWPISIRLGGILESMVVDGNNNLQGLFSDGSLRSFDINGKERWIINDLILRRNHHLTIDKDGSIYIGGNRYLYLVK